MGLYPPDKPQMDGGVRESEGKKWVVAGIPLRRQLKPIFTKPAPEKQLENDEGELPTTPTGEEARVPARVTCPAAPRKRKSSPMCHYGSVREYFNPPDLETVFIRRVERA
ncbi:hypothetical protein RHSIM_Rhsim12G0112000 [Rhododendron simsii]|uniref:Cyclin-dependent protein kinase inhibitor SMR6 n=1 Tax=Rhododendron simsii TaxID=118357 RepID=A0A834G2Q1_RHOSS|nr:hypothetical protein RHSIM_Rhsim12G0112000 [Rhododendron simsii]